VDGNDHCLESANVTIRGERVTLGALLDADIALLFDWINERPEVVTSAPYHPVHYSNHMDWFDAIRVRDDAVIFAVRTIDEDELIGYCQLHSIHPIHRSAELQMRIGNPAARGKGYGPEAMRLLMMHGFEDLNLWRIYGSAFVTNERALNADRKAGFTFEGRLRDAAFIDGEFVDMVVMSILKPDFYEPPPEP
jgi:RimJ/RimL family protein N-acetyltransferase